VLPVTFLALGAVALSGRGGGPPEEASRSRTLLPRAGLTALAIMALVAIAIPLLSTVDIRDSQARAARDDLSSALTKANAASDVQPYAARPPLQRALVLETAGSFGPAAVAARDATQQEPVNWRNWLVLSRIEAELQHPQPAIAAYRRAKSLNPRSPIFAP
jgi:cytochrome c-type biogenesis protein CcmH/NrfG